MICGRPFAADDSVAYFQYTDQYLHPGCVYEKPLVATGLPWFSSWPGGDLRCEECGAKASGSARGWRAYLAEPDSEEDDGTVMYCPVCAAREFGPFEPA
jgi:hypothetical protein